MLLLLWMQSFDVERLKIVAESCSRGLTCYVRSHESCRDY